MSKQILGKVMISNRGEYNQYTNYERLDLVGFNGSSFLCKKDCVNISTDNEEYWQLIASKGDTYQVSEEDIQIIANQIVEDANSGFNQNVDEKTTTFNSNAATKTTEFNNNATSKTDEFNTNVDTKTEDYDTNAAEKLNAYNTTAEEKTTAFNSNAATKTTEFNNNATSKTDEFNTNVDTKTEDYDTNAAEKLNAYNTTAEEKTTTFNSNAATKTTEFNNNATSKTDEFNTNVDTKTEDYDTNAAEKLNAYNTTAEEKTTAFNSNASSKKEEYDTNATSKTNDFNTNANTRLSEFNDNADSYDKRITDNSNRINRIETDLSDSGTASGKYINLKDSTLAEFQEVGIEGVIKQETTKGYQLLNLPNGTENGMTYSVDDDGYFNFSGTCTSDRINLVLDEIPLNGTYTFTAKIISGDSGSCALTYNTRPDQVIFLIRNGNQTLTNLDVTANKLVIYLKNGTTYNTKLKLMLVSGNEEKDIEKYTGGEPSPSPDYPQEIEVIEEDFDLVSCGKNLWGGLQNSFPKTSSGITGVTNADGTITINGTSTNTYYSILSSEILPNGIYVSLPKGTYTLRGGGTDYVLEIITNGGKIAQTTYTKHSVSFTLDEEMKLAVRVNIASGNVFDNITIKPQLEQGTVATDYEPYRETRTTITLPEGEFAGKIDENTRDKFRLAFNEADGNYHLYLDKMIGKVVLDGSEDWIYSAQTNSVFYLQNVITDFARSNNIPYCNYYKGKINVANAFTASSFGGNNSVLFINSSNNYIYIVDNRYTSASDFKIWLSTHNTEVYYLLETPYTLDLGVVDMLLSYYPVTNVYITCDLQPTIEVKYYRDFKKTMEELQDKVSLINDNYVKKTDYGTNIKPGILQPSFGITADSTGKMRGIIFDLETYTKYSSENLISKGTLENVLEPIRDKLEKLLPSVESEAAEQ